MRHSKRLIITNNIIEYFKNKSYVIKVILSPSTPSHCLSLFHDLITKKAIEGLLAVASTTQIHWING